MKGIGSLLVFVAAISVGCGKAADNTAAATTTTTAASTTTAPAKVEVSSGDKDFINDMSGDGMAEVQLGKLAVEKAASPAVKEFAQKMVDDHKAADEKLSSIASQHAIPTPISLDSKHQELYDKLSKLKGAQFDREYMNAMADGHKDVLGQLESRIDKTSLTDWKSKVIDALPGAQTTTPQPPTVVPETSDDPVRMQINRWAADAYPTVYRHLQTAKKIDDQINRRQAMAH